MFKSNPKLKTSRAMRPFGVSRLLGCVVAVSAPLATAQNPLSTEHSIQRSADCLPRASRAKESCDPKEVVVRIEKELTVPLDLPPLKLAQCTPSVEIAYTQRDTVVSVEGTLQNKDCAASSGDYTIAISIRNEKNELTTVEFPEPWQRHDDQPVRFTGTYPIGENVDVVRVRPVHLRCTCADAPGEAIGTP
ncbi:MAG TPA: hypothetical protein VF405_03870 [Gammaproteobacteria bacterium]